MLEYLSLIEAARNPEAPLWARRTMLAALKRVEPYMDPRALQEYAEVREAVRRTLTPQADGEQGE